MTNERQPDDVLATTSACVRRNYLELALLGLLAGTFVYFFGLHRVFMSGRLSAWEWGWQAWNPETNYEHAKLVPFIVAFLVWHAREKLAAARIGSSRWGWVFIAAGIAIYIIGVRTLQGRLPLVAFPVLLFGIVLFVWGREVARVLRFPIAFLLFTVPLNFLTQATANLQFLETGAASAICNFIGIHVTAVGTVVTAVDNAFRFQVDEGCSGVRSLMAIMMLSAIYGHLTQDRLWKKLAIFGAAILFAIVGNAGRLVSIFAVAKWFGQDLAGGPYHTASGYLSFPFAIGAMVLFAKLLNVQRPRVNGDVAKAEAAT